MSDPQATQDQKTLLFANLVIMLGASAMQQLGTMPNPLDKALEVNMEGAKTTIDMISALKDKTQGNLSSDEEKMISELLSSLQLSYVEISKQSAQSNS